MEINQNSIKEVLKEILSNELEIDNIKKNMSVLKNEIIEEYCRIKGFYKKNGEPDKGKIKFSVLLKALKKELDNDETFEEIISYYEGFKKDIRNSINNNSDEDIPLSKLKKYREYENNIKAKKEELKELEKEVTVNQEMEIDKKLFKILTDTVKEYLKSLNKTNSISEEKEIEIKKKLLNMIKELN